MYSIPRWQHISYWDEQRPGEVSTKKFKNGLDSPKNIKTLNESFGTSGNTKKSSKVSHLNVKHKTTTVRKEPKYIKKTKSEQSNGITCSPKLTFGTTALGSSTVKNSKESDSIFNENDWIYKKPTKQNMNNNATQRIIPSKMKSKDTKTIKTNTTAVNLKNKRINTTNYVHKPTDSVHINSVKKGSRYEMGQFLTKTAPLRTRLAHQLRLAVHEGGSFDPRKNLQLKQAIKLALDEKMPISFIERTIQKCVDPDSGINSYLLQLRFQQKVYVICTVHTEYLNEFKRQLAPLFKQNGVIIAQTLHMFHNAGIIEAIVPFHTAVNFEDLEETITRDATACRAKDVEIVDYETGAVNFKCLPLELSDVCKNIQKKGYTIMHTEYNIRPKSTIALDVADRRKYKRFLEKLYKINEIENIYDNVRKLDDDTDDAE